MTSEPLIEICVEGVDGVLAAEQGGADRAELCAALIEGGITPSLGTVQEVSRRVALPFVVMVRPRGGDFLYSPAEFATMLADTEAFAAQGVAGVVAGCLTRDGAIDEDRMAALVARAGTTPVVCHRAFDMTPDPFAALAALVRCGVRRVLTSGQGSRATDAIETLRALVDRAGDRIVILGCGELDESNIAEVRHATGLREMHFSAPMQRPSAMAYRNPHIGMGGTALDREYINTLTDPARVRATIAAARAG